MPRTANQNPLLFPKLCTKKCEENEIRSRVFLFGFPSRSYSFGIHWITTLYENFKSQWKHLFPLDLPNPHKYLCKYTKTLKILQKNPVILKIFNLIPACNLVAHWILIAWNESWMGMRSKARTINLNKMMIFPFFHPFV